MIKSEKTIKKILDKPYYNDPFFKYKEDTDNLQSILERLYWADRQFAISRIRTGELLFQAIRAIMELILEKMPKEKLRAMDYNQAIKDMRKVIEEL